MGAQNLSLHPQKLKIVRLGSRIQTLQSSLWTPYQIVSVEPCLWWCFQWSSQTLFSVSLSPSFLSPLPPPLSLAPFLKQEVFFGGRGCWRSKFIVNIIHNSVLTYMYTLIYFSTGVQQYLYHFPFAQTSGDKIWTEKLNSWCNGFMYHS